MHFFESFALSILCVNFDCDGYPCLNAKRGECSLELGSHSCNYIKRVLIKSDLLYSIRSLVQTATSPFLHDYPVILMARYGLGSTIHGQRGPGSGSLDGGNCRSNAPRRPSGTHIWSWASCSNTPEIVSIWQTDNPGYMCTCALTAKSFMEGWICFRLMFELFNFFVTSCDISWHHGCVTPFYWIFSWQLFLII